MKMKRTPTDSDSSSTQQQEPRVRLVRRHTPPRNLQRVRGTIVATCIVAASFMPFYHGFVGLDPTTTTVDRSRTTLKTTLPVVHNMLLPHGLNYTPRIETPSKSAVETDNNNSNNNKEEETYEKKFARLTVADPNQRTLSYRKGLFQFGLCNQIMAFTALIMYAYNHNYTQVLLPSLHWNDMFGTNQGIPHEHLFDVVHWNQHYAAVPQQPPGNNKPNRPPLPRLVLPPKNDTGAIASYAHGVFKPLFNANLIYNRRIAQGGQQRHPSDQAILLGALRSHPQLHRLVQDTKKAMLQSSSSSRPPTTTTTTRGYMCLHARIEPDMQNHTQCLDQKERSLQQILAALVAQFPTPPHDHLLIVLNRKLLEQAEPDANTNKNTLARDNLAVLNQIRREGLWNGTVRVHEAGIGQLPHTAWHAQHSPSIAGSLLDYELAVESNLFVGSPVSSFAMRIVQTRYHRNKTHNYLYLPHQTLQRVDPHQEPPPFDC